MEEYVDAEEELTTPPFWIQNTVHFHKSPGGGIFFGSGVLLLFLLLIAVFFMLFVVTFNTSSVNSSWDSLNLVLVLVAVVFVLLSRTNNDETNTEDRNEFHPFDHSVQKEPQKSNPSTPEKWGSFSAKQSLNSDHHSDRLYTEFSDSQSKLEYKNQFLRRNSSSYPDLRETSSSLHFSHGDYYRWRPFDDQRVDPGEKSETRQSHRRHRSSENYFPIEELETKTVISDKLTTKPKLSPLLKFAPPAMVAEGSMPVREENRKSGRSGRAAPIKSSKSVENMGQGEKWGSRKERSGKKQDKDVQNPNPILATPYSLQLQRELPPPEIKTNKSERKRSSAAVTVSKDTFNSLYYKKKNKQRQMSADNLDPLVQEAQALLNLQLKEAPPPPPPPPPPPYQALLNNQKQRKEILVTLDHASTPTPALTLARRHQSETNSQSTESRLHNPLVQSYENIEENTNSSVESPINRIPTPPPPPPPSFLKTPTWKFVVEGDYVRINSDPSQKSGLSDLGETDSDMTPKATYSGNVSRALLPPATEFCPSPDVNTKAETFITKFRAKLKLERIHSLKKRELDLSNSGP